MGSADTALALQLTSRQASDFELLANGGFAPLTGFLGSADWRSVCDQMRRATGEIWWFPITQATTRRCGGGAGSEMIRPKDLRP